MAAFQNGSLRLFRVAGVDVMIHWSWILFAAIEMQFRGEFFKSPFWDGVAFLTFFGIVMLHEIGHVTACRQVGGTADRIILLPFGGAAVVNPPPRPWPVFWSVAGGPLVNVALIPVTILVWAFCGLQGWTAQNPDLEKYFMFLCFGNIFLLVFNLLPMYPNDGGQMLYTVLWAAFGRGPGLMIVSAFGVVTGLAVALISVLVQAWIIAIFAGMLVMRAFGGFVQAQMLIRRTDAPRHQDATCPACHASPVIGEFWVCDECRCRFDTFETLAECPRCLKRFEQTMCLECHQKNSIMDWFPRKTASAPPAPSETPYRPTDEWDQEMPREYY
jgi:Zn-dependent protease